MVSKHMVSKYISIGCKAAPKKNLHQQLPKFGQRDVSQPMWLANDRLLNLLITQVLLRRSNLEQQAERASRKPFRIERFAIVASAHCTRRKSIANMLDPKRVARSL